MNTAKDWSEFKKGIQDTSMQTWGFLHTVGKNLEINRCLNYFLSIGKLYSFIELDTSEEKNNVLNS